MSEFWTSIELIFLEIGFDPMVPPAKFRMNSPFWLLLPLVLGLGYHTCAAEATECNGGALATHRRCAHRALPGRAVEGGNAAGGLSKLNMIHGLFRRRTRSESWQDIVARSVGAAPVVFLLQPRFNLAIEADQRDPHAVVVAPPYAACRPTGRAISSGGRSWCRPK